MIKPVIGFLVVLLLVSLYVLGFWLGQDSESNGGHSAEDAFWSGCLIGLMLTLGIGLFIALSFTSSYTVIEYKKVLPSITMTATPTVIER